MKYILLPLVVLLASCGGSDKKAETQAAAATAAPAAPIAVTQVVGIATIEPLNRILSINSEVSGIVREVLVQSSQHAAKGQALLMLDSDVERAQLAQAQSKLATQKAAINATKAQIESLKVKLANAKTTFERNKKLVAGNALTAATLDDNKFTVEGFEKDIAAQEANIVQAQARLSELETDIKYYETLVNRRKVVAPANGTVLNLEAKLGSNVTNTVSLGDFAPDGNLMATTEVDELFADKVRLGQAAYIRLQGSEDKIAEGKVVYLAPYLSKKSLFSDRADNLEDRRVREVRVELQANATVLIGSRVECVISVGN